MKHIYLKPQLENLSQGERIAFVRQFRLMTQDEVSDKLGLTGECKRRTMTRYERDDRCPKKERLLELTKQIRKNPLKIELKVDEEFDMNSNRLFYDASVKYVNQLNKELEILEIDEDLIEIRKY